MIDNEDEFDECNDDWPSFDDAEVRRIHIHMGNPSPGLHLFDADDNTALKDFLEGILAFVRGSLWQHAAIATDVEVVAILPRIINATEFAEGLARATAKFFSCTRLGENDLVPFRFALRDVQELDANEFQHERQRLLKLRTAYNRLCNMQVGSCDGIYLPASGRSRRTRRF